LLNIMFVKTVFIKTVDFGIGFIPVLIRMVG